MIARRNGRGHRDWRAELRAAERGPAALAGRLPSSELAVAAEADALFSTLMPAEWLAADLPAAVLRQAVPGAEELAARPGFTADPLAEGAAMVAPGVLRKYAGRVLLVATGACPIHCRYCFRRQFPYREALAARDGWRAALAEIAGDATLHEVIVSGGDPLTLATPRLAALTDALAPIERIRRFRIHTRTPVVLPSRVDDELLSWLAAIRPATTIVLHVNHPAELTPRARAALGALRSVGATLLNQSVLLAGVNDAPDTLVALSETLFEVGVLPYYLHLLDPVAGAAHFAVPEGRAQALFAALQAALPGYLVPRLVREVPGDAAKRLVAPAPP